MLVVERADELGGTTALSGGRVWVPGNHCPENSGDTPEAARTYLDGLFPAAYPHMPRRSSTARPPWPGSSKRTARTASPPAPHYPDYHPGGPGRLSAAGAWTCGPADLTRHDAAGRLIRTPPGYLPMTHAEWEQWRYPYRFDRNCSTARERDGIRTNGVALVAALLDGAVRAGVQVVTGARLTRVHLTPGGRSGACDLDLDGTVASVRTSSVILATGGFDWDQQLRASFLPPPQRATGAPPSNTGDGLRIAGRLGAADHNLAEGWWMPMMAIPGGDGGRRAVLPVADPGARPCPGRSWSTPRACASPTRPALQRGRQGDAPAGRPAVATRTTPPT